MNPAPAAVMRVNHEDLEGKSCGEYTYKYICYKCSDIYMCVMIILKYMCMYIYNSSEISLPRPQHTRSHTPGQEYQRKCLCGRNNLSQVSILLKI